MAQQMKSDRLDPQPPEGVRKIVQFAPNYIEKSRRGMWRGTRGQGCDSYCVGEFIAGKEGYKPVKHGNLWYWVKHE